MGAGSKFGDLAEFDGLDNCPFYDLLIAELVLEIDAAYKTDFSPGARANLGSSYGGFFTACMGPAQSVKHAGCQTLIAGAIH